MRPVVEGHQHQRALPRVLNRVRNAGRNGEPERLSISHPHLPNLAGLAPPHQGRPHRQQDFGRALVEMVAPHVTRFGEHHMHVSLRSDLLFLERLHHPAARVGMELNFLDCDS